MMTALLQRLATLHRQFLSFTSFLQHPLLLLIRLYWGYDFFQTGLGKLNNLERTTEFFQSLDIPFAYQNAIAAGTSEMVFGLLLMAGLASRLAAVPLIVIMAVAYATDDREALLNIVGDPEAFVNATPFLHLLASLIILVFGPGALSADALLRRFRRARPQ